MPDVTRQMLRDYLNDALPEPETAAVERALRDSPQLQAQLRDVLDQEDRGEHSVGAIWRRERVSCPTRDQLGGFLLGAGDDDLLKYVRFHIEVIGCPYCQANLDDLKQKNKPPGKKK
jgi:hypothetical protein